MDGEGGRERQRVYKRQGEYILLVNNDTLHKNDAISMVFNYLR